jgi:hypothetical protein
MRNDLTDDTAPCDWRVRLVFNRSRSGVTQLPGEMSVRAVYHLIRDIYPKVGIHILRRGGKGAKQMT